MISETARILSAKCSCGYDRTSKHTDTDRKYSLWGWVLLTCFGISTPPKSAIVKCLVCHEVIIDAKEGEAKVLLELTY